MLSRTSTASGTGVPVVVAATSASSIVAIDVVRAMCREHDRNQSCPKATHLRSAQSWECQRHLPWGSVPFDEINAGDPSVLVYLTSTFRSQSFSLSQRLTPTRASWLCFAPHPSLGLRPSELLPHRQPWRLSALDSLLSFRGGSRRPGPLLAHRLRLQSLHPAGRPTPIDAGLAHGWAAALLVFLPFEACRIRPRGRSPPLTCFANGPANRAEASCASMPLHPRV